MTQSDQDTSNDMSRTEHELGIVELELMNGRVTKEVTEERKEARRAPRAAHLTGTLTGTKEALETKAKAKARARVKPDVAALAESKGTSKCIVNSRGPTA